VIQASQYTLFCGVRIALYLSFTVILCLLKQVAAVGFTDEADAYMGFITERFHKSLNKEGGLPIMFTIRGDTDIPEQELDHLDGYKGSRLESLRLSFPLMSYFKIIGWIMGISFAPAVFSNIQYA
jgi:hypothetical protein